MRLSITQENPLILNSGKLFLVHCFFLGMHSLLLLGFVVYQFIQPLFLNSDTWTYIYTFLFLSFSVDCFYFYFYEKLKSSKVFHWLFLFIDTLLMTLCLSTIAPLYSVLIFIYMLHIISAGLLGHYKGAFLQGLWVSVLFSWVFIINPAGIEMGEHLALSFALSNVGFILVAGLSGFIGYQADKMQWSLMTVDKALNHLENLNEVIVENINMGLFIVDENSQVIHSNKKALSILDLSSHFTSSIYDVFPELKSYISDNKNKVDQLEVEYQSESNASVKNIELFISPIKQTASLLEFNSVENSRYLLLFQDCTMIREMERETQEKEKFSSIGRMATGIAHELRNPLSSIGGSIQLLDLKHKDNAENKRLMEIALREISRLNRIIGEFLDYSADENSVINKVEPIHINPVLEELLDSVRVNPKWDGITHHVTLKSQGLVQGNVDKLKQIFWNIIKNACEAMESKKEGLLELECFDDDAWVVIRVKDNGTGLKDDDRDRMYEPFFSKKAQGTGLGLAIARKQIEFYKGDISHQNRESGGTVCTIRFPIQPSFFPEEMAKRKTA